MIYAYLYIYMYGSARNYSSIIESINISGLAQLTQTQLLCVTLMAACCAAPRQTVKLSCDTGLSFDQRDAHVALPACDGNCDRLRFKRNK